MKKGSGGNATIGTGQFNGGKNGKKSAPKGSSTEGAGQFGKGGK